MADDSDSHDGVAGGPAEPAGKGAKAAKAAMAAKHDRLKLALRENLKRRKSQLRGRDRQALSPSESGEAAPYDRGDDGS